MQLLLLLFEMRVDLLQFLALLLEFLLLLFKLLIRFLHFLRLFLRFVFCDFGFLRGGFGDLLRLLRFDQQLLHLFSLQCGEQHSRNHAVRFVQEILGIGVERLHGSQFDDTVERVFIQERERVGLCGRVADRAGQNQAVLPRRVLQQNRGAFQRDLPDDAFAEPVDVREFGAFGKGECAEQFQGFRFGVERIERAAASVDITADETDRVLADLFQRQIAGQREAELAHAVFQPTLALDFRHHSPQVCHHFLKRPIQQIMFRFRRDLHMQFFIRHLLGDGGNLLQIRHHVLK
ncbi:hypothetical protein U14_03862 [Candidatus Moduliflexus flocculans]|uniref:Uncharacterized protein n=1 Tax=Candidatus Moduliflexus flocculans TaxID=1499966 RepID=A0A081BQE4_9BACT|nr:hypothetical protein U14_03862 [Candidatus Moduliflexus flocculans]